MKNKFYFYKVRICLVLILSIPFFVSAQNSTIDSLKYKLSEDSSDTALIYDYYFLGVEYQYINETDTAFYYYNKCHEILVNAKSKVYSKEYLKELFEVSACSHLSQAQLCTVDSFGSIKLLEEHMNRAYEILSKYLNNQDLLLFRSIHVGCYHTLGLNNKVIELGLNARFLAITNNDTLEWIYLSNLLALSHEDLGNLAMNTKYCVEA